MATQGLVTLRLSVLRADEKERELRYLITGGAGFIGSHLAHELLSRGHRVHALDDLSTGSITNIRHLRDEPYFEYTIDSCASSRLVAELVDEADVVFHLAAAVGVQLIVESPVRTIETNVHCTEVVLAQASKKRRPVFVASRSEVYGKSTVVPSKENGDLVLGSTDKGRWSYACSKAIDEFLALATTVSASYQRSSLAYSTPSGRARPASTGWLCRRSCDRRWRSTHHRLR